MVRLIALVAFVHAGCGRLGFGTAGDGGGDDGSALLDRDGDGVLDTIDNCPDVPNPDQANEDGDAEGDVCDTCPVIADGMPGSADTDGDGVADGCDPNPAVVGDQIVVFDGFAGTTTTGTAVGAWSVANGAVSVASALNEVDALTWMPSGSNFTVSGLGTIDANFGNLVARPVGVASQIRLGTNDAIMCVFGTDPSNNQVFALATNATTSVLANEPAAAGVGATSTFVLRKQGISYTCAGTLAAVALTGTNTLNVTPNQLGLFTRSASAHFEWVMIVRSP